MKKKLLSVLLALTMMLTVLPVSAMAAELTEDQKAALEAQGYSEEEIANAVYIDEDTELTEDVEGLIIIVAPVKVTVKGAKLATGLLVLPGAKGAAVVLGENADVNAVIVMDTAEVTVEEKAVAASVTVTAPEAKVAVAGEVKAVTVAETAAGASVAVAENATVSTLEVAAPDVKAEVAGTVESVTVAETATGAELAVAENATVTEVTDNTGALTVSGDGAANVTVTDTTAEPAEDDKKDEEEPEEDKKDEEEPAEEDKKDENNSTSTVPPLVDNHKKDPGFTVAPQVDKEGNTPLSDTYSLSVSNGAEDNEFRVVIKATNVVKHTATEGGMPEGYWVGLAIPKQDNYSYYLINCSTGVQTDSLSPDSTYTGDNGVTYDTFYFNMGVAGRANDGGVTDFFQLGVLSGDNMDPDYIIDIAFDATLKPETPQPNDVKLAEAETEEPEAEETDTEKPETEETGADKPEIPAAPETAEGETVPAPETPAAPATPVAPETSAE